MLPFRRSELQGASGHLNYIKDGIDPGMSEPLTFLNLVVREKWFVKCHKIQPKCSYWLLLHHA